jgi:hypothetical protein
MTLGSAGRRSLLVSAFVLLLPVPFAAAQQPPAPSPPGTPAAGQTPPAKTPAKTPAAKTKAKGPVNKEGKEIGLNTAEQAAATLRSQGEVVSQTGSLHLAVESNVYADFPGFDLTKLPADRKQAVIERANKTYCTCGCKGDTVARCVVNDASCQAARRMLQAMIDQVTGAAPAPVTTPISAAPAPKK